MTFALRAKVPIEPGAVTALDLVRVASKGLIPWPRLVSAFENMPYVSGAERPSLEVSGELYAGYIVYRLGCFFVEGIFAFNWLIDVGCQAKFQERCSLSSPEIPCRFAFLEASWAGVCYSKFLSVLCIKG